MKTIYRKRTNKTRYEVSNGPCFIGVHFGKRSLYIAKPVSRVSGTPIKSIRDDEGFITVTTVHKNFYQEV